jgi:hypothetical protein
MKMEKEKRTAPAAAAPGGPAERHQQSTDAVGKWWKTLR